MDAIEDKTPGSDPAPETANEAPAHPDDPFGEPSAPMDKEQDKNSESESSTDVETEQVLPLAEASFRAGVSVQALRQRIKRGTLEGADAIDARGQKVAGVRLGELRRAFPRGDFFALGAGRSKPPLARETWDPEADLERGGMAPNSPQSPGLAGTVPDHVAPIDTRGFPATRARSSDGLGVGLWGIGLIVALAAVAVAGLMTGARQSQAATRSYEIANEQVERLTQELEIVREERDRARSEAEALARQLKALDRR